MRKCKKRKTVKQKTKYDLYKKLQKRQLLFYFSVVFCKNAPGNSGSQDFLGFLILRYVGVFVVACAYGWGLFSVIFIHFLQQYRCVPKIAFPADILMENMHFLIDFI